MNNRNKLFPIIIFSLLCILSSCINIEQTTKINEDGSGSITLHYWTTASNISMSDEIGGFSFNKDNAKRNFSSVNSEVTKIDIDTVESDSTIHIKVDISFKDINKISDAAGFSRIEASWNKLNDEIEFIYIIKKDSTASGSFGAEQYKLEYKFEFPGEVISTNGSANGKMVTWNKSVADLNQDIVMNAKVKTNSKICGIFGIELPFILLLGFILTRFKKLYFNN